MGSIVWRFLGKTDKGNEAISKKIVVRSTLTLEELNTVLIEINVINSRPVIYVYDDEELLSYPLKPSQLSNGRQISPMPNSEHFEIMSTNNVLTKAGEASKEGSSTVYRSTEKGKSPKLTRKCHACANASQIHQIYP